MYCSLNGESNQFERPAQVIRAQSWLLEFFQLQAATFENPFWETQP
jgi:hypothetical protein